MDSDQLQSLLSLLKESNMRAMEVHVELKPGLAGYGEQAVALDDAIAMLDFAKAAEILTTILAS